MENGSRLLHARDALLHHPDARQPDEGEHEAGPPSMEWEALTPPARLET